MTWGKALPFLVTWGAFLLGFVVGAWWAGGRRPR
jgi:hypothetical protein